MYDSKKEVLDLAKSHSLKYKVLSDNHVKVLIPSLGKYINFYCSSESFNIDGGKKISKGLDIFKEYVTNPSFRKSFGNDQITETPNPSEPSKNLLELNKNEENPGIYKLKYKKVYEQAYPPHKSYDTDAGIDLFAIKDQEWKTIIPGIYTMELKTGIALEIPKGFYLATAPRSSSLFGEDTYVFHSILDAGYMGEISFKLLHFNSDYKNLKSIKRGDKIAQVVMIPIPHISKTFEEVLELPIHSDRMGNGFGHSGKNIGDTI